MLNFLYKIMFLVKNLYIDYSNDKRNTEGWNVYMEAMIVICIIAALGGAGYAIYIGVRKLRIEEERSGITSQIVFLKDQWNEADQYRKTCGEKIRNPVYESYRRSFESIRNFIEEEQLSEQVQAVLELKEFVDMEGAEKTFADMEALREDSFAACVHIAESGKKYDLDVDNLSNEEVHEKYLEIQSDVQNAEHGNRVMVKRMKEIHGRVDEMLKDQENLNMAGKYLQNLKERSFRCNLVIYFMEEECVRARNRSWYWQLDDITVMNYNLSIAQHFNIQTGIVFFPYEGEDEATGQEIVGVLAAAVNPFEFRETVQSEDEIQKDTQAILEKGRNYRLELTGIGTVFVNVE